MSKISITAEQSDVESVIAWAHHSIDQHPGNQAAADSLRRFERAVKGEAGYDPDEKNVDEVLAYLADHPDEVDAIKAAEAAGKGRAGIRDYEPA